jgi:ribosomal protein S8
MKTQTNLEFIESLQTENILNVIGMTRYPDNRLFQFLRNFSRQNDKSTGQIKLELMVPDEYSKVIVQCEEIKKRIINHFTNYKLIVSVEAREKFAGYQLVSIDIKLDMHFSYGYGTHKLMSYPDVVKIINVLVRDGFPETEINRFVKSYALYH